MNVETRRASAHGVSRPHGRGAAAAAVRGRARSPARRTPASARRWPPSRWQPRSTGARDIVVSNHRCHGHYLAWTDDPDGLLAEVMGKATGVCGGLGGSQHLVRQGFFSNGIQGGIVPVAAGLAFAQKLAGDGGIVAVCIGDGTLGEGVVYETFNMAAKWRLPLLVVLENNLYAQSTSQSETLAGDICARAAAFGIATSARRHVAARGPRGCSLRAAAATVRRELPPGVRARRHLSARGALEGRRRPRSARRSTTTRSRDPLNAFLATQHRRRAASSRRSASASRARSSAQRERRARPRGPRRRRSARARRAGVGAQPSRPARSSRPSTARWATGSPTTRASCCSARTFARRTAARSRRRAACRTSYPDRVLNTPISEAGIVGIANGLALGGRRPIVEIMFGDFLGAVLRPALQPRGQVPRHVQRPRVERHRRPHADGRRPRLRPDAQPEPREALRRRAGLARRSCCTAARAIAALYRGAARQSSSRR